jgi:hypothetical protein
VGEGDFEVSGGKGRRVQKRAARGSDIAKPKRRFFTKHRREQFLSHFAASCNAAAAARAVGVSENTVYTWRKSDAQFQAAWGEALAQGYARLEAELVRESQRALSVRADRKAAVRVGAMDAKTALAVLEAYRRSGGRAPGEVWPHPYDAEAVRRRLEAKMRLLGADVGAESADDKEVEDPSTSSAGSPPPESRGRKGGSTASPSRPSPEGEGMQE